MSGWRARSGAWSPCSKKSSWSWSTPQNRRKPLQGWQQALETFIRDYVRQADSDLTTADLVEGFSEYAAWLGLPPPPTAQVARRLPGLIRRVHGARPSHSLVRQDKTARGYRGVTFTGC